MTPVYQIEKHSVHLWHVFLPDLVARLADISACLGRDELARAARFHFEDHRVRFIIAHGVLRQLCAGYTGISPQDIVFATGERGKPSLKNNPFSLQFNMSHSHEMAVYAFTSGAAVGIDIEKMEENFDIAVARRFFSEKERAELFALSNEEQPRNFYRLWVGREALIKSVGGGIFSPQAEFSIDLSLQKQMILVARQDETHHIELQYVVIHPGYSCAVASSQITHQIICRQWQAF